MPYTSLSTSHPPKLPPSHFNHHQAPTTSSMPRSSSSTSSISSSEPTTFPNLSFPLPTDYETPESLFNLRQNPWSQNQDRYIRRSNNHQILIRTAAAAEQENTMHQRAGWAFTAGSLSIRGRLEDRGPNSESYLCSLRRAEIRAVLAVLEYKNWGSEGFNSVVITTESSYVFTGLTACLGRWVQTGFLNINGLPLANRDLWESIYELLIWFEGVDVEVLFWEVPRVQNNLTHLLALDAANMERVWVYNAVQHW